MHMRQIGVPRPVPDDLGAHPVETDDEQSYVRVVGARRRVGDPLRLPLGVRRIRDPPAAYGRVVDPCDEQPVGVRGPPETPRTAHLLGRDELGESIGNRRRVRRGLRLRERPVALALGADDPQGAPGDVRDVPSVGGGARVDHRSRDPEFTCRAGPQFGREKPP
ncbi:hypothetical protein SAV14893_024210 [Streptomyces avermitilis]|uniref:Uncharacterized protein n=1 Tax=Streptomyces avermitilis TaxID=33903 RepID=A0A4D4LX77_STRAX|nr:hypothetical protein SAV14893_024210 [Streptomyces avermitilis]